MAYNLINRNKNKKNIIMERYIFKGNPNRGLYSATLAFFIGFGALAIFAPLSKQMKEIMQLNGFQTGFLLAIPQLSGSLLRIPFGAWANTIGGKKPLILLLLTSIIGMILLSIIYFYITPILYIFPFLYVEFYVVLEFQLFPQEQFRLAIGFLKINKDTH